MKRRDFIKISAGFLGVSSLGITPARADGPVNMKFVVVGDAAVGKTSALMSYITNAFPSFTPKVYNNHTRLLLHRNKAVYLSLWDTAGGGNYDRIRPLSYTGADLIIVMFSIVSPSSFENAANKWLPELQQHAPGVPLLLVGNKGDLRDQSTGSQAGHPTAWAVSPTETEDMRASIGAHAYCENSALTQSGLKNVFTTGMDVVMGTAGPGTNPGQPNLIASASTSTALFIGKTQKGPANTPTRITGLADYEARFGTVKVRPQRIRNGGDQFDHLGQAMQAYFANGGKEAFLIRIVDGKRATYAGALNTAKTVKDASMIILPGKVWRGADKVIIQDAIAHAEAMKDRMVIIDPPRDEVLTSHSDVTSLGLPSSSYAAFYYPWLKVKATIGRATTGGTPGPRSGRSIQVAPSAFAAGVWARTDHKRGVWKAPAGIDATLQNTSGPAQTMNNASMGQLSSLGVNCILLQTGSTLLWGARTLANSTDPEQKYIPVRRTEAMIRDSLSAALEDLTGQPNSPALWSKIETSVSDFLEQLYRAGAFQGAKPQDGYFVKCGLGTTMTQIDIANAIVKITVGFAPLKPAEFVVLNLEQKI